MFNLVVIFCLFGVIFCAPPQQRIVGGSPIDITQVPYQIAVGNATSIWCGGSIISEKFIVTAAHCFNDHDITTEGFLVFVGMTKLNEINPSMAKGIVSVHVHPEYDRSTQSKDIAIMELNDDLNFNTKVKKIDLPRFEEETPVNAYGYASGWGKLSENGPTSVNLQNSSEG
ncbi:trypsin-like [Atheta coriaria]|uniref:trypsin-like n=1 Tax=Dalotia coriaria TaxID=877792 RepID=UPI0031F3EE73